MVQDLSRPGITSKGFTGERVWFEKNQDIFKGIPENEAFLHYSIRTGESIYIFIVAHKYIYTCAHTHTHRWSQC